MCGERRITLYGVCGSSWISVPFIFKFLLHLVSSGVGGAVKVWGQLARIGFLHQLNLRVGTLDLNSLYCWSHPEALSYFLQANELQEISCLCWPTLSQTRPGTPAFFKVGAWVRYANTGFCISYFYLLSHLLALHFYFSKCVLWRQQSYYIKMRKEQTVY